MDLSVCMIARNEEDHIGAALQSVKDYAREIIVVDTGSSDRTKEIARSYGAKIYDFSWCDDFSAARNESLKHASGAWILVLDADEVIAPQDMEQLHALEGTHDGYLIEQRNYTDDHTLRGWMPNDDYAECRANGYHPTPIVRLFRNRPTIRFRNRVHEEVDTSIRAQGGTIGDSGIPIHHYGLLKNILEEKRDKYLDLGLAQIRENPSDHKARYEIARIYKARGQYEKATEQLTAVPPSYRHTLLNLADCYAKTGNHAEAIEYYKRAIKAYPKEAHAYINFGIFLLGQQKHAEAIELFTLSLRVAPRSAIAYQNLIGALIKAHRPGDAFKACLSAIDATGLRRFKDTAGVLRRKLGMEAQVCEALHRKDYERAEEGLKKLINDKQFYGHYLSLSRLYERSGKKDEAKHLLAEGIQRVKEGKEHLQKRLDAIP